MNILKYTIYCSYSILTLILFFNYSDLNAQEWKKPADTQEFSGNIYAQDRWWANIDCDIKCIQDSAYKLQIDLDGVNKKEITSPSHTTQIKVPVGNHTLTALEFSWNDYSKKWMFVASSTISIVINTPSAKVTLTPSQPDSAKVMYNVDGLSVASGSFKWDLNSQHQISVPQKLDGGGYIFKKWSSGDTIPTIKFSAQSFDTTLYAIYETKYVTISFIKSKPLEFGNTYTIDDIKDITEKSFKWLAGSKHHISTNQYFKKSQKYYMFLRWTDNNPYNSRDFIVPEKDMEMQAIFNDSAE